MKRAALFVLWILAPALPIAVYFSSVAIPNHPELRLWSEPLGDVAVSTALGLAAFTWLAGQMLLASRPKALVAAVGLRPLLGFHGAMGIVAWVTAFIHRIVVQRTITSDHTVQARLGTLGWLALGLLIAVAVALMANGPLMRVKALASARAGINRVFGLSYPRLRALHRLNLALTLLVLAHALLAPRSALATNPLGAALNLAWALFCVGAWLRSKALAKTKAAESVNPP